MKKCKNLKMKLKKALFCNYLKKEIAPSFCVGCIHKSYKTNLPTKRTRALSITKKTKMIVWERDNHRCIFCQKLVPWYMANSHLVKRSQGGLGIEKNIITNCEQCHHQLDDTPKRKELFDYAVRYLNMKYKDFNLDDLTYKKR